MAIRFSLIVRKSDAPHHTNTVNSNFFSMPRPAKTTQQLKREGTYRKDRHAQRLEVPPADGIPAPPPTFDERHADKWREVCERLKGMSILTKHDVDTIQAYCTAYFDLQDAEETLRQEGKYLHSDTGTARVHPAWRVKNDALKTLRQLSAALGFSPLDRTRVNAQPENERKVSILDFMEVRKIKPG